MVTLRQILAAANNLAGRGLKRLLWSYPGIKEVTCRHEE